MSTKPLQFGLIRRVLPSAFDSRSVRCNELDRVDDLFCYGADSPFSVRLRAGYGFVDVQSVVAIPEERSMVDMETGFFVVPIEHIFEGGSHESARDVTVDNCVEKRRVYVVVPVLFCLLSSSRVGVGHGGVVRDVGTSSSMLCATLIPESNLECMRVIVAPAAACSSPSPSPSTITTTAAASTSAAVVSRESCELHGSTGASDVDVRRTVSVEETKEDSGHGSIFSISERFDGEIRFDEEKDLNVLSLDGDVVPGVDPSNRVSTSVNTDMEVRMDDREAEMCGVGVNSVSCPCEPAVKNEMEVSICEIDEEGKPIGEQRSVFHRASSCASLDSVSSSRSGFSSMSGLDGVHEMTSTSEERIRVTKGMDSSSELGESVTDPLSVAYSSVTVQVSSSVFSSSTSGNTGSGGSGSRHRNVIDLTSGAAVGGKGHDLGQG